MSIVQYHVQIKFEVNSNTVSVRKSNFFNPLPNGKFLDLSRLKAIADDKINVI